MTNTHKGTKVVATDLETGKSTEYIIQDNYVLVVEGSAYLHHVNQFANGTVVLTVKRPHYDRKAKPHGR